MLCPSCNKFAAQSSDSEPEVDVDIDEEGRVTGSARIVITSECCGDELKEANFDIDIDASTDIEAAIATALKLGDAAPIKLSEWELSVESDSAEITDRSESESVRTKKDGTVVRKPIPYRYQKRFYGIQASLNVTATKGDETIEVSEEFEDEVPAGGMDELV